MKNKIVFLGSLNIDFVAEVEHLPQKGETVKSNKLNTFPGGKGANQAITASRMGSEAYLVGGIGKDKSGKIMKKYLTKEKVKVDYLKETDKITGLGFINVDEKGNNSIVTYPGANNEINLEDILNLKKLLKSTDVSVLHWDVNKEAGEKFIELSAKLKNKVIFNYAPVGKIKEEIFEKVDVLIINEVEANQLTNINIENKKEIIKAGNKILNLGVSNIIFTLGGKGVYIVNKHDIKFVPAIKIKVKDTTAAGDTFIGAFASYYNFKNIKEAVEKAVRVAGLTVSKIGAYPSIPTLKEVKNFNRR